MLRPKDPGGHEGQRGRSSTPAASSAAARAGGGGLLGNESGVGSERIRRAMRMAERDDKVKAVVIRIDSPGGSALASEAMYQAVRPCGGAEVGDHQHRRHGRQRRGTTSRAAATTIIADPAAIVGSASASSAAKLDMSGLYDKIGL